MLKRSLFGLAIATGLLAGSLAGVAHAAVFINTSTPFAQSVVNPCNGDAVALTGTVHEVGDATSTPSGGAVLTAHVDISATGVGATGTSYVFNGSGDTTIVGTPGGTQVVTAPMSAELISTGSLPNAGARMLVHLTINADGTLTAVVDSTTARCNG